MGIATCATIVATRWGVAKTKKAASQDIFHNTCDTAHLDANKEYPAGAFQGNTP